jgi:hypothetical protein
VCVIYVTTSHRIDCHNPANGGVCHGQVGNRASYETIGDFWEVIWRIEPADENALKDNATEVG